MLSVGRRRRSKLQQWSNDHLHDPQKSTPDDWPTEHRLPAAKVLPVYCGDYAPGLTGLYSVLNGLKLLMASHTPLKPSDERQLLEIGWNFMKGREAMPPNRGMRRATFIRLAEAMSFGLSRRRGEWVRWERTDTRTPHSQTNANSILERQLVAGRVVLVLLGWGEYTVLRGYTETSWLLFDAAGRHWIRRKALPVELGPLPVLTLWHAI